MGTIIDINIDNNAQPFQDGAIIHNVEMQNVSTIIDKLIMEASNYEERKEFEEIIRKHNAITISGERGSGKTSFLMTLKKNFSEKKVVVIDIIDPTLIEEKGHIFLNILAHIKENVDTIQNVNKELKSKWEVSLRKLADGLPMLDGIQNSLDPSDWNDSTFVMFDGLRRVSGANNLEKLFHNYIKFSLEILQKNAFLIMFDDVDTDFAKGWPVLETLRKYMTSPQLITLISGDLALYTMLIRKKQWANFGKELLKNEYDKNSDFQNGEVYTDLVAKLESQYALKILKPENRILLSTIASKPKKILDHIKVKIGNDTDLTLKGFYQTYFREKFAIKEGIVQDLYINFFLSLPIRSQISLMKALTQSSDDISKGMFNVFYTELKTLNVNTWELINDYGLTNIYLLKCLYENKILDEGSQFIPKTGSIHTNGALSALGFLFSERVKENPYELFDHIIRISMVVDKANTWRYSDDNNFYRDSNISDFIKYSRSLFDYGLQKIASLQIAYIVSDENNKVLKDGIIPLKRLLTKDKKASDINDTKIDEVFKLSNRDSIKDYIGWIPAIGLQDNLGYSELYYSFNCLIASIGDIIAAYNTENSKERVLDEFIRMSQLRYYNQYKSTNSDNEHIISAEEADLNDGNLSHIDVCNDFNDKLCKWIISWNKILIPPYLLGRIMIRTYFSFNRINVNYKTTVAELLHRQLICLLNAILIEEVMELYGTNTLILNNPTNKDDTFVNNYKKNDTLSHPLFDYIFDCPLIKAYLNPEMTRKIGLSIDPSSNVYESLNRVKIKLDRIKQFNRSVRATEEDAYSLILAFGSEGISKQAVFDNDGDALLVSKIKELYTNQRIDKKILTEIKDLLIRLWN